MASEGIKRATAEVVIQDPTKFRDLSDAEKRSEANLKTTLCVLGFFLTTSAVLLISLTAANQLPYFFDADPGIVTYFTYSIASIAGLVSLTLGIFHDAETCKYPYSNSGDLQSLKALTSCKDMTDLQRLATGWGGHYGSRLRNFAALVRSNRITIDQFKALDQLIDEYLKVQKLDHETRSQAANLLHGYAEDIDTVNVDVLRPLNGDKLDKAALKALQEKRKPIKTQKDACESKWTLLKRQLGRASAAQIVPGAAISNTDL